MKQNKGRILVWVDMLQKSQYELRCGDVMLQVKSDFGSDGNVKNPVLCERYDGSGFLLVHHNTFDLRQGADPVTRLGGYCEGDTGVRDDRGRWLFSIQAGHAHLQVGLDGDPVALDGWKLCQRVWRRRGGLLEVEPELLNNVVWIDGKFYATYNAARYRSWYIWDGVQREVWRVREDDLLGIIESEELITK